MKTKTTKRFGALLLALVMIFSLFPSSAFAAEGKEAPPAAAGEPAAAAEPARTEDGAASDEEAAPAAEDGAEAGSDDAADKKADDKSEEKDGDKSDKKDDKLPDRKSDKRSYMVTLFGFEGKYVGERGPYDAGQAIGQLPALSEDGYAFLGWLVNREGEPVTSSYPVNSDLSLYASFEKLPAAADEDAASAEPARTEDADTADTDADEETGDTDAPAAPMRGLLGAAGDGDGEPTDPTIPTIPTEPTEPTDPTDPPNLPNPPDPTVIYTITWIVEGEEVTSTVTHGEVPVYPGDEPTKEATDRYTYEFSGWSPAIAAASGDAEYTAVFDSYNRTYDVTFYNYDNDILYGNTFAYGDIPEYTGVPPTREEEGKRFVFTGWDPEIGPVTGVTDYYAQFREVPSYEITWLNHDGSLLGTSQVFEGDIPEYEGETPTRPDEGGFYFVFSGWDKELYPVDGSASYAAVYTMKGADDATYYGLDFVVGSTNVAHITVREGDAIGGQMPADPDASAGKKFVGWFSGGEQITADTIVTGGLYVEAGLEDVTT